jgi:hypothetical protein
MYGGLLAVLNIIAISSTSLQTKAWHLFSHANPYKLELQLPRKIFQFPLVSAGLGSYLKLPSIALSSRYCTEALGLGLEYRSRSQT